MAATTDYGRLAPDRGATMLLATRLPGHVANRLQAGVAREVYYLVATMSSA